MLVLTRRLGESITIGEDIRIIIVDVEGSQVKVGIDAPKTIKIYREELYAKIKGHNFAQKKETNHEALITESNSENETGK